MPRSQLPRLWLRLALPFALFVAIGSSALVWWMNAQARRESEAVLMATARANADFVQSARLPVTDRTARNLGAVLGMRVFFRRGETVSPAPDAALAGLAKVPLSARPVRIGGDEVVAVAVNETTALILARAAWPARAFLLKNETLWVLAAFWALSFALAWALTRNLVRPAALMGRMTTGLAHEIHNPLAAIRLHAQLVETSAPEARESLAIIRAETQRIESLVNQWMFLARPAPPQTASTALAPLIAGIVRTQSAQAEHAGVKIETEIPATLTAKVDARRVSQAIGNVIINAIQAMPRGGTLRITAPAEQPPRLIFEDTGPGFSTAALAHAADLFFSEKEGGMGIGLNVAAEIAKAHGGNLQIANHAEEGARVTLTLPSVDQSAIRNPQSAIP